MQLSVGTCDTLILIIYLVALLKFYENKTSIYMYTSINAQCKQNLFTY